MYGLNQEKWCNTNEEVYKVLKDSFDSLKLVMRTYVFPVSYYYEPGVGHPRIYPNNAAKMKAYRARKSKKSSSFQERGNVTSLAKEDDAIALAASRSITSRSKRPLWSHDYYNTDKDDDDDDDDNNRTDDVPKRSESEDTNNTV